ncbi:MAG: HAD family hydrolase [Brevinematia bacterium]
MQIKGVVFDFNGTLFWDTEIHNIAWNIFLNKYGINMSDREKFEIIHGKNNEDILRLIFSRKLSDEKIKLFINEKEKIYQNLCLKKEMQLAIGAEEFLSFLKENKIPFTIATASGYENVCFYFEKLKLDRFFDLSKVVYNDGKIKGKPDPEIYLKAIKILGIKNYETLVFEDSPSGIKAAENANVGKIIIVDSANENYNSNYQKIKSFSEVDRNIFFINPTLSSAKISN